MKTTTILLVCDVCLAAKTTTYELETNERLGKKEHWTQLNGEIVICPRCAFIVNRATAMGWTESIVNAWRDRHQT